MRDSTMTRTYLLFILSILSIALLAGCSPPKEVQALIDCPAAVGQGAAFDFTVTVTNGDSKPHQLRSIDVSQTFLDGVGITATSLPTTVEYHAADYRIFEFNKEIPAHSEVEVVFSASALRAGDFSGGLDACIDGDASCIAGSIHIAVE